MARAVAGATTNGQIRSTIRSRINRVMSRRWVVILLESESTSRSFQYTYVWNADDGQSLTEEPILLSFFSESVDSVEIICRLSRFVGLPPWIRRDRICNPG